LFERSSQNNFPQALIAGRIFFVCLHVK
jgi:hypothetical protein